MYARLDLHRVFGCLQHAVFFATNKCLNIYIESEFIHHNLSHIVAQWVWNSLPGFHLLWTVNLSFVMNCEWEFSLRFFCFSVTWLWWMAIKALNIKCPTNHRKHYLKLHMFTLWWPVKFTLASSSRYEVTAFKKRKQPNEQSETQFCLPLHVLSVVLSVYPDRQEQW